ncbi:type III pantothenate kinase [Carboxydochorda subterranea]|uniref:Type III pantothenate kinase n=1 Tax=Carboxydichorda subterranea TaxID=3109565 RepID=A0ABZ1BVT2_9FIRM|nr:type III pantothenate kinase [Limnochorda sp. L945t]WRP16725.1 type III pantothenate kinase [Limnochorda sp. L945t]
MLLAVDVGNTTTGVAVYEGERLVHHWWLTTFRERTADELALTLSGLMHLDGASPARLTGAAISSVVPSQTEPWRAACRRFFGIEPLVIGPETPAGVKIGYRFPEELGADRIVNAAAAVHLYGAPVVVVDFGTATTFDVVDARGEYVGGAIAPGVGISAEALFERAARLPRVELSRPPSVIGRTTAESIQSGIVFGFAGQVDGIVRRILKSVGGKARVVATGGLASLIAPECETVEETNPLLTLEGLRLIFARHQASRPS